MQEINDGNNVIFEAAGEEANVIFGCVQKEEMNDYVSYTVIATGFDSSQASVKKAFTIAPPKRKEEENFRGGFNFLEPNDDVDKEDLEIPTIYRVKSPKMTLEEKVAEETPRSGFEFDASRYSWTKEKAKKKDENDKEDDEDSSSFLRMIMD
jgi:cell division protein FtsZ